MSSSVIAALANSAEGPAGSAAEASHCAEAIRVSAWSIVTTVFDRASTTTALSSSV